MSRVWNVSRGVKRRQVLHFRGVKFWNLDLWIFLGGGVGGCCLRPLLRWLWWWSPLTPLGGAAFSLSFLFPLHLLLLGGAAFLLLSLLCGAAFLFSVLNQTKTNKMYRHQKGEDF